MAGELVAVATVASLWRMLNGTGPIPKAIARLIDTLSNRFEIKNELVRASSSAQIAMIEAKSEADVKIFQANAGHVLKLFEREAAADRAKAWRLLQEEKRQHNRERILMGATEQLGGIPDDEVTTDKKVDPDWTTQFFNFAQDVSNEEMQALWSRLLAGEVLRPGSFGIRTLEKIKALSSHEAMLFSRLCSVAWKDPLTGNYLALTNPDWFNKLRIRNDDIPIKFTYDHCLIIQEAGLIEISPDLQLHLLLSSNVFEYFDDPYTFMRTERKGSNNTRPFQGARISLGAFRWTQAGNELVRIASAEKYSDGYIELLRRYHRTRGMSIVPTTKSVAGTSVVYRPNETQ